jgi:hypothetical protein
VGKLAYGATATLTASQADFMKQVGPGFLTLMMRSSSPQARAAAARIMSKGIISCMSAKMGEAIFIGMRGVGQDTSYIIHADQKANMEAFRREVDSRREQCDADDSYGRLTAQYVNAVRLSSHAN